MKNLLLLILITAFSSCNVPKDGKEENIPTSKLEVLTDLGEDSIQVATEKKDSAEKK